MLFLQLFIITPTMAKYDWLEKKRKLSVDGLRPWADNPRLNPEESHITIADYAEDMVAESRTGFIGLLKSIAETGFLPFDPIIVWKSEENGKYYVAEGNRRLIALKVLRDPTKAPKSIRATVRKYANKIDKDSIQKVSVYIAPNFEAAEWYINQRNSTSSLQRRWNTIQQLRWVASLYKKYDGDIEKLIPVISLEEGELNKYIRILKMWEFVNLDEVKSHLSEDVYEKASSYKFPATVLERFFASPKVRELWGIEFDGADVIITSNKASFYAAFAELIRKMFEPEEGEIKIDTRTITSHFDEILEALPEVNLESDSEPLIEDDITEDEDSDNDEQEVDVTPPANPYLIMKDDPNRNKLVLPIYSLYSDSARLSGLFDELKIISLSRYPNIVAASLRIFLDLAILNYIRREGLEVGMQSHYQCGLKEIPLKRRIEYIKTNKLTGKPQKVAVRLLDESNHFSLDVLNGFIHSSDTHYMSKSNMNRFWDFLFPLFCFLLDIREDNV